MNGQAEQMAVTADIEFSPDMIAALFWNLNSKEQADFFASLERVAGINLCFQMAGVVREIVERSDKGDFDAYNGFQTMLSHASSLAESAIDYRIWAAKDEIKRQVSRAKLLIGRASA